MDTRSHDTADQTAEVVLVVEDEVMVRTPICRSLRKQGYFVLEAKNGEDALQVMQAHHSPIHLVITDVMMPEMDGAELVSMLRDWYPRLRILFMSGYSPHQLEALGENVNGIAFLAKPFSMEQLGRRVREILDAEWTEESPA
jgi:two-component system, cell cycle sensor histidine kinase and response regulator CckA